MAERQDDHSATKPAADLAGLRCPKCDYDLTGACDARCPECGDALCIADIRQAQRYSNKPLEGIARTFFLANGFCFGGFVVIVILSMFSVWVGPPNSSFQVGVEQIVSAFGPVVVIGLVTSVPFSVVILIIAIMCENDRATCYCVFSILMSIIAAGLFMFAITGW